MFLWVDWTQWALLCEDISDDGWIWSHLKARKGRMSRMHTHMAIVDDVSWQRAQLRLWT